MPLMNVTELDVVVLTTAAIDADNAGKRDLRDNLDRLQRSVQASLINERNSRRPGIKAVTWRDVESAFEKV
jgi:hypothetical protein